MFKRSSKKVRRKNTCIKQIRKSSQNSTEHIPRFLILESRRQNLRIFVSSCSCKDIVLPNMEHRLSQVSMGFSAIKLAPKYNIHDILSISVYGSIDNRSETNMEIENLPPRLLKSKASAYCCYFAQQIEQAKESFTTKKSFKTRPKIPNSRSKNSPRRATSVPNFATCCLRLRSWSW